MRNLRDLWEAIRRAGGWEVEQVQRSGRRAQVGAQVRALLVVVAAVVLGASAIAGAQTDDAPAPAPTTAPASVPDPAPAPTTPSTTKPSTTAPAPEAPAIASGDAGVAALAIDGWVADGDTGVPLSGICVTLYSADNGDAYAGHTVTAGDGSWSFTPAVAGGYRLAYYRPSVTGDCFSTPLGAGPVPEWAVDQALSPADPLTATPPATAAVMVDGSTGIGECLGDSTLHAGGCERHLTGTGVISGTVVAPGPTSVAGACVYVLADLGGQTQGNGGMTDAEGRFVVSGLAEELDYVVAAVAPFERNGVPCQTDDGPPPASIDGLQPEFYPDIWIDLSAPELEQDVVGWARTHGAQVVRTGATGVDLCLTTDAGDVTPRGVCAQAAAAADTTATGEAQPATAVTGTLPLTGGDPALPAALGATLVALGVGAVVVGRRRGARA